MGEVLRHYWMPLLFPHEVTADGPPLRTRLLGEDLIAFRDSAGRIGLLQNSCPHRGASLFFGRNEEAGLRCVYHGWTFDVTGQCVDMPSELAESNFRTKVRAAAYPAVERGGMVWVYMGRQETPPPPPDFEWCLVPEDQRRIQWKAVRECNWVQALEGDLDSSHTGFLHARLDRVSVLQQAGLQADLAPIMDVEETDVGVIYGARRSMRDDSYYWRTTQFVLPFYGMFPSGLDGRVPCHIWVPIDDNNTLSWGIDWHPLRAFTPEERAPEVIVSGGGATYLPPTSRPHGHFYTTANASNDYLLDREVQRTETFSGIPTVALQDTAVTESMGTIYQRDHEHLGTSDSMIIRSRRRLIGIAKAWRDEATPPPSWDRPEAFRVRSCAVHLPRSVDWKVALADWHAARGGLPEMRVPINVG
jgi:nitrite reductase/ring-hydroxylating ferredoxin subunit